MTSACKYLLETNGDRPSLDMRRIRQDFPILKHKVHGRKLVYLDNAATAQKPRPVLNEIRRFYEEDYANIHRGVHLLSRISTDAYENARAKVQKFIGAQFSDEIVFTRNATEAINLVAATFGQTTFVEGDNILLTHMEHHSNIVPWWQLCQSKGAKLLVTPVTDTGELDLDAFESLIKTHPIKLLAVTHVSNVLGTINPVHDLVKRAHEFGIAVLVDGAQAVPHIPVNVQEIGCDFYVISSHKMYGPSGIGALYAKRPYLQTMPTYQGGGDMIESVGFDHVTFAPPPQKFEAGTPDIAGAVGFGMAADYLREIGMDNIAIHEQTLIKNALKLLGEIPGLHFIGQAKARSGVISFTLDGIHPHDIGTILDMEGIAIRTGHHCAQPLMERFRIPATARASFGLYTTRNEIGALAAGLHKVIEVFR